MEQVELKERRVFEIHCGHYRFQRNLWLLSKWRSHVGKKNNEAWTCIAYKLVWHVKILCALRSISQHLMEKRRQKVNVIAMFWREKCLRRQKYYCHHLRQILPQEAYLKKVTCGPRLGCVDVNAFLAALFLSHVKKMTS